MSSTSLRTVAATVAAVVALLTAIATGLLSTSQTCTNTVVAAPSVTTAATNAAGGVGGVAPGGIGDLGTASAGQGQRQAPPPKATTAPAQQAAPSSRTCQTESGFAVVPALVAFLGTVFLGAVLMLLLLMASRSRGGTAAPVSPAPRAPAVAAGGRAESERTSLIQAVIYVRDRVTSKALADRLGTALHDVGVEVIDPVGARFDPAHHEAGGSQPSDDPALVGSIAAVEVPGYADRGRLLRAPVVTVYQAGRPSGRGTDRTRGEHR